MADAPENENPNLDDDPASKITAEPGTTETPAEEPKGPSADEIAAARAVLAKAQEGETDAITTVMRGLIGVPSFSQCYDQMVEAQRAAPAITELSYAISMMARLRDMYALR